MLSSDAKLEKSLHEATAPRTAQPGFPRRPTQGNDPLSYAQEGLWFFERWQLGDPVNRRLVAFRLSGPLDVRAMERSVSEVIHRHQVLRAAFRAIDGQPV